MNMVKESVRAVIARNLRKYRTEQGLSQEALSLKCGMHHTYIGLLERQNYNVTIETIEKIANTLGITEAQLLERED